MLAVGGGPTMGTMILAALLSPADDDGWPPLFNRIISVAEAGCTIVAVAVLAGVNSLVILVGRTNSGRIRPPPPANDLAAERKARGGTGEEGDRHRAASICWLAGLAIGINMLCRLPGIAAVLGLGAAGVVLRDPDNDTNRLAASILAAASDSASTNVVEADDDDERPFWVGVAGWGLDCMGGLPMISVVPPA